VHRRSFLLSSTAHLAGCGTVSPESDPPSRTFGEPVRLDRTARRTVTAGTRMQVRDVGWTEGVFGGETPGVSGVVENVGDGRLFRCALTVEFFDGETLIATNTNRALTFLAPGEFGRLEVPFTGDDPTRVTALTVEPWFRADSPTPLNSGDVAVSDDGIGTDERGRVSTNGTVATTSDALRSVFVRVNYYDGPELLGQDLTAVTELAPGETKSWSTAAAVDPGLVTRQTVLVTIEK